MYKFTPFCYLLFFSAPLFAQTPADCPPELSSHNFHSNNLRLTNPTPVGGSGSYFIHALEAGYDGSQGIPGGQYSRTFWVGGLDPGGNLHLAATFPSNDFDVYLPGPLNANGVADPLNCARWNRLWSVNREEIELHRTDFADNGQLDNPLPGIVGWPGRGNPHFGVANGFPLPDRPVLAPFFDNNSDGIYNAYDGDYPHPAALGPGTTVAGIAWSMFNSSPTNLVFEFQSTYWALGCDDNDALNNTIFQSLHLRNAGSELVDSLFVGLFQDPEMGSYEDDFVGTNPALNTIFVYNADNIDGPALFPNFGDNPPAFALTVLSHPLDNTTYYATGVTNPPAGMSFPVTPGEFYNYLTGRWRDGSPMTADGSGYQSGGLPTRYIFTGDLGDNSSWAMLNEGLPFIDMRTLANVKIGKLLPGQSAAIDYAYSFHRGAGLDYLGNVGHLFQRVTGLQTAYFTEFNGSCSYTACTSECVWPGDTNRDGIVNNFDLLPLSAAWGATGPARNGFVNWAPKQSANWGPTVYQTIDYKHADPNGNGTVELNDAGVVGDFYGNTTPWWSPVPDSYPPGADFFWGVSPPSVDTNNVLPNQTLLVTVRYDSLVAARGGAFELTWDTAYWNVTIATGGSTGPGILGLFQKEVTQFNYARIRTDSLTGFPDGAWALLQLKSKTIAPTQSNTTYLRLKNIRGIAADGSAVPLGAYPKKFKFAGGTSDAVEPEGSEPWRISPNPATATLALEAPGEQLREVVFYDVSGRILEKNRLAGGEKAALPVGHLPRGLVFVQLRSEDREVVRKVVLVD